MTKIISLPDELVFNRIEDFDGFAPLTDEEWQRFWAATCEFFMDWSVKNLRDDIDDENDNVIHVDFSVNNQEGAFNE
jgi:hypothetical protein